MRRIRVTTLVCLLLVLVAVGLAASCGAHQHEFSQTWSSNAEEHWHAATCGDDETADKAPHTWGEWETVIPANGCGTPGTRRHTCTVCGWVAEDTLSIPHTPVAVPAVDATCEQPGHTAGSVCSTCGDTLTATETIPALGHSRTPIPEKAATCKEEGSTGGEHCERCGEIYVAATVLPRLPHTPQTIPAVPPTSTSTGLTEGSRCSVCGDILQAQQEVPMVPDDEITLIENGVFQYRFVYTKTAKADTIRAIDTLIRGLRAMGITVQDKLADTSVNEITDKEIVVGAAARNRGAKIAVDVHDYGETGWSVSMVGTRILIVGGEDEMTRTALAAFQEKCLGYTAGTTSLGRVTMKKSYTDGFDPIYALKGFEVLGVRFENFILVVDSQDETASEIAKTLQKTIYHYTGHWAEIVNPAAAPADTKQWIVRTVNDAGTEGFRVYPIDATTVVMECAYENTYSIALTRYLADCINDDSYGWFKMGEDYLYTYEASVVRYSDFGAVGDGKTDDFDAIFRAHEFANACGQTVKANSAATYYIGWHSPKQIIIKTNVEWGSAKFIIDDSEPLSADNLYWKNYNIFVVKSDYSPVSYGAEELAQIPAENLKKTSTNIGMTFDYDAMLYVKWSGNKVYIRYGGNQNDGTDQQEVILVDRDGNINKDTPLLWDYGALTSVVAYRIDDKPITVSGGIFTTIANQMPSLYNYYSRGINIERSNAVIRGVTHYITGEMTREKDGSAAQGAPYSAFIAVNRCNNVLVDDCVFSGHYTYNTMGTGGTTVSMGSYDISSAHANNITWRGCTQANSITNSNLWGLHGSNFCKNLTLEDSEISRFDAHQGMYNATIRNSTLGRFLNCIGAGTLLCENVTRICGADFLTLRSDYGSVWEGDMIIRNCTMQGYAHQTQDKPTSTIATLYLMTGSWVAHNFGYKCYMPTNVKVENFTVTSRSTFYLFNISGTNSFTPTNAVNPYTPPAKVSVSGLNMAVTGTKFGFASSDTSFFATTEVWLDGKKTTIANFK